MSGDSGNNLLQVKLSHLAELILRRYLTSNWTYVNIYPQSVRLGRNRYWRPMECQVLFIAVDIADQLHHWQGAGGAHSQTVVLRPDERMKPADRRHERDDGLPLDRHILRAEEDTILGLWFFLNDYITGQRLHRIRRIGGRHVFLSKGSDATRSDRLRKFIDGR